MGKGLRGARDRVVLSSRAKPASATSGGHDDRARGDLRRLRTDHLDIYFNHAVNDLARLQNEEWWAFTERAKAQGKIRFRGISSHGSRLAECLEYAIEHEPVDVVLVACSFGQDPEFVIPPAPHLPFRRPATAELPAFSTRPGRTWA